jgi:ABC-type branched-subunit amino acid transport system ATPase component
VRLQDDVHFRIDRRGDAAKHSSVNNIEVIYDHVILVLKGVSLVVPEGGIVALLGANGAGKTTTLKAISNLLRRARRGDQGIDRVRRRAVEAQSANELVRRGCIQVMEGRHCFGHLTVEENLLTGAFTRATAGRDQARHRDGLQLFPAPARTPDQPGRLHIGRRTADVRHRPGADAGRK